MTLLIQHAFQDVNGLSEDRYVNTFHAVPNIPPLGGDLPGLATCIKDFYQFVSSTTDSIRLFMAYHSQGVDSTVKMWNLDDPIPRDPIYEEVYDPPVGTSSFPALPTEVACCLSFEAAPVSGIPQARKRGRIYIGPLNTDAVDVVAGTQKSRPDIRFQMTCVEAYINLIDDCLDAGYVLVQYSPTTGNPSGIVRAWMDDAWDTQRRRGIAPTGRYVLP